MNRSVPEILQDGTNTYVYGLGIISSTDGSGVQTYYDSDGLGSTSDLTDSSHTKTDGYTYDAFGTPTHSPGSSSNSFQFTGQQTDADTGLQYMRARYYDPSTGRFLSKDPLPIGNRYSYVSNNPTTMVDPLGLCGLSGLTSLVDCIDKADECVWNQFDCVVDSVLCLKDPFVCTYTQRSTITIALESAALADALATGGTTHDKEGGITEVTGCGGICNLVGRPFTIGHTIFTNGNELLDRVIFAHEKRHVRQFEVLGDLFWPIYVANAIPCLARLGDFNACVHDIGILERLAGPS